MTLGNIYWAMTHDWFYYAGRNSVTNESIIHVRCDMVAGDTLQFTDFNKLQEWAGY